MRLIFTLLFLLLTTISEAQVYLWINREHATDCTAITDGTSRQLCYEEDSQRFFKCEPTAGGCDTAGEWKEVLASLTANPSACSSNQFVTDLSQAGALTCAQPAFSDLSGSATDAQVPDTITVDLATLATTATTANAGDSATAFFSSGQIERARGGTGADTSAYGNGIIGSNGSNTTIDIDTIAEIETAIGGTNVIVSTEIDTLSELNGIVTDSTVASLNSVTTLTNKTIDGDLNTILDVDDDEVNFDDADSNFSATTIGAAVEELDDVNGSGPNASDGKVEWTQLVSVPAGFADGSDDGASGSVTAAFQTFTSDYSGGTIVADGTADSFGFISGTNITITTNATNDTVTIASTASGAGTVTAAFQTFTAVTSGDNIIADGTADTLNFIVGTGLSVTSNATNDSVSYSVLDNYLLNTGDVGTGVYDFGGVTSFEMANSASLTVDASGEIYFEHDLDRFVINGGSARTGGIANGTAIAEPLLKQFDFFILEPDLVQAVNDEVIVATVDTYNFPSGITLTGARIVTDASCTTDLNLEEWTSPDDSSPVTLNALSHTGNESTDTSFSDASVASGNYILLDLNTTNIPYIKGTIWYYANQ